MSNHQLLMHLPDILRPDPSRTVLKPFDPSDPPAFADPEESRAERIAKRVLALGEAEAQRLLNQAFAQLEPRHRHLKRTLRARFEAVKADVGIDTCSDTHALLVGSYFVEEYSFEAAALFNPSIVPLPDQAGCPAGGVRFALSLRGIGEGHVSSVTFRTGTWVPGGELTVDPPSRHAATPTIDGPLDQDDAVVKVSWPQIVDVSEAVLFPVLKRHRQGIEDARFVRFVDDDGSDTYYATVTAYSGSDVTGDLIVAERLTEFALHPLTGSCAGNKGMALFPRRIDGKFAMLGRQDNENLWLMFSDDIYRWDTAEKLLAPHAPWEFVQIGNCGSPIEVDEGWLVLTHGVGPARAYAIGACLLDKADPSKVLGRTALPLIHPGNQERDGYVPNVVYSCGALLLGRTLLLPYGVADSMTRFATASVDDIIAVLQ